jgi:O-antigen ligase
MVRTSNSGASAAKLPDYTPTRLLERTRPRVFLEQLFVAAFVFLVVVVSRVPSLTTLVLWVAIPACALASLWYVRFRIPRFPELWWRAAFIGAAAVSVLYAADVDLAGRSARALTGTVAVWLPVVIFVGVRGHFRVFWAAMVVSGLFLLVDAGGGFGVFAEGSSRIQRLTSELVTNANSLSFRFLEGLMGAVFLAWTARSSIMRILLLAATAALGYGILLTGSRKTALVAILFVVLWFVWRRIGVSTAIEVVAVGLLVVTQLDSFLTYVQESTPVGQRFEAEAFERGIEIREGLIEDSLRAFLAHPIVGVGVGNTRLYTQRGQVAHNDLAEIAASLGLIGLALYLGMYAAWSRRMWRLWRTRGDDEELVFMRSAVVSFLALGLGAPMFSSLVGMMVIGSVMAHSYYLDRWSSQTVRRERSRSEAGVGSVAFNRRPAVPPPVGANAAVRR